MGHSVYYASQRYADIQVSCDVLVFGFLAEKKPSLVHRLHARQSDPAVVKKRIIFVLIAVSFHYSVQRTVLNYGEPYVCMSVCSRKSVVQQMHCTCLPVPQVEDLDIGTLGFSGS